MQQVRHAGRPDSRGVCRPDRRWALGYEGACVAFLPNEVVFLCKRARNGAVTDPASDGIVLPWTKSPLLPISAA